MLLFCMICSVCSDGVRVNVKVNFSIPQGEIYITSEVYCGHTQ